MDNSTNNFQLLHGRVTKIDKKTDIYLITIEKESKTIELFIIPVLPVNVGVGCNIKCYVYFDIKTLRLYGFFEPNIGRYFFERLNMVRPIMIEQWCNAYCFFSRDVDPIKRLEEAIQSREPNQLLMTNAFGPRGVEFILQTLGGMEAPDFISMIDYQKVKYAMVDQDENESVLGMNGAYFDFDAFGNEQKAKYYRLSNGVELTQIEHRDEGDDCYSVMMVWFGKEIPTTFTVDMNSEYTADAAVELFERVYLRREYYIMLARHLLKTKLIEKDFRTDDKYLEIAEVYREDPYSMKFGVFEELLASVKLAFVIFGNEGEIAFGFDDYGRDVQYILTGTENEGFTVFEEQGEDE